MGTAIENRLTEDLQASVAGMHLPPGLLDAARRRNRRRRLAVRAATGTAVAAAITGVLATTMTGGPAAIPHRRATGNSPSSATTASAPKLETVAYVRRRIAEATDPDHAIIRTYVRSDGQVNDNWSDTDTGYNTAYSIDHGQLISASRYPVTRAGRDLEIYYPARTWFARPAAGFPHNDDTSGKVGEPRLDTVAGIKAAVRRSDVTVLGHGPVAGRPATHIRFVYRRSPGNTITGDAWFDSQTFAPLRATTTYASAAGTAAPPMANGDPRDPGAAPTIVMTTSFLPRTAANVARTHLAVPNGFREIAPPSK